MPDASIQTIRRESEAQTTPWTFHESDSSKHRSISSGGAWAYDSVLSRHDIDYILHERAIQCMHEKLPAGIDILSVRARAHSVNAIQLASFDFATDRIAKMKSAELHGSLNWFDISMQQVRDEARETVTRRMRPKADETEHLLKTNRLVRETSLRKFRSAQAATLTRLEKFGRPYSAKKFVVFSNEDSEGGSEGRMESSRRQKNSSRGLEKIKRKMALLNRAMLTLVTA